MSLADSHAYNTILIILLVIAIAAILYAIVRAMIESIRNRKAPEETVYVTVVSKRVDIDRHQDPVDKDNIKEKGFFTKVINLHYATFETKDGKRAEFYISGRQYDKLNEGDKGKLIYKGTEVISFDLTSAAPKKVEEKAPEEIAEPEKSEEN